jgi:predicted DCC family thiol-disulfide oxidoreductase YuxK
MEQSMTVHYPLTVYFDGSCKLCASEIGNLAARDTAGKLVMVDCSPPDFDLTGIPATHVELMNLIHAQDARGNWIRGVDVFVAAYAAARLPWVSAVLAHPRIKPYAQSAYPWVVRNRYYLSLLGLHKIMNFFSQRARRRAQHALARTQACKTQGCEVDARGNTQ